ncbi:MULTISPECIES: glucosamine-6-phosphate isomerase [unclassified Staphylococcus]|uniref:6-phosphogluconolactonase n=1 Tax=unclassified Staphylococcus TaxID=91994 RepID=UPI0021D1F042|nr:MULTISPECIES: glucosamine-6-phosphate isomerase [unclassified Staphylococcus]UXR68948.1 glucosamine-6-phosphate isomerase [Staphylococcus sp. IVB6246]UXR71005.1 glucosamine-6-phosphate isomerase [Staphylococcus sp. IVB6240]UXR73233.1 glucosamine-6-phosphate isomerase [Staphylococcus sp. IVB6238]UXR75531.1 glucosamine-6-phosphate isomerase [Staphylococcus sp. IVB6233]UXR79733.1 glucosamine-6-phosphate isomerase [Staphylococcus sp. IVB6218]
MAMNFKIFKDQNTAATFVADILRKQFSNNPTTIAGIHLKNDDAPVNGALQINVENNPVDFSQIHILDYDKNDAYFKALGVPEKQIHEIPEDEKVEAFIKHHAKTKENKGKLTLQVVTIDTDGSIGIPMNDAVLTAREIVLVLTGAEKAEVVRKLYEENGSTTFVPSSLKSHRMVNVVLDEAAAQGLPEDVRAYFSARFA